jgi:hypothetical protein
MDMFLGVPSVVKDPDTDRRSLYGKAGCFRFTPYGVEYRTLSSYMMKTNQLIGFVYDQTMKAIKACNEGRKLISNTVVQRAINESNVELSNHLIEKYKLCVD